MKLLIVMALLTSAATCFANAANKCDDKVIRPQVVKLLNENISSFGNIDKTSLQITTMIPENVVSAGASPIAAFFQTISVTTSLTETSSWIGQFSLSYNDCRLVYLGAARTN